jgi:hypothetical protein
MTINMTNFAGNRKNGRDYSVALRDLLPTIIGSTPMTMRQIEKVSGRDHETVRRIIGKVRHMVHIAAWTRVHHTPTPLYLWGAGEDAPRPRPLTYSEKSKKYRSTENGWKVSREATMRWKQTPAAVEYKERRNAKIKAARERKSRAQALLRQIDPLMAAFIKNR